MKSLFPRFRGEQEDVVRKCILWTWARLRKVRWENDRIRQHAYRESPEQMVRNGTIFYMNPCALQTITCALVLKQNGIEPVLNMDMFEQDGKMEVPHFSLEFTIEGKRHYIDFRTHQTLFNEGHAPVMATMGKHRYLGREQIESTHIRSSRTIHDLIMSHAAGKALTERGYQLESHLEKLVRDNTPEKFTTFDKRAKKLRKTQGLISGKIPRRKTH